MSHSPFKTTEDLARFMHDAYEEEAGKSGWATQESCRVPFESLPEKNQVVMLAVASKVLDAFMMEEMTDTDRIATLEAEPVVANGQLTARTDMLNQLSNDLAAERGKVAACVEALKTFSNEDDWRETTLYGDEDDYDAYAWSPPAVKEATEVSEAEYHKHFHAPWKIAQEILADLSTAAAAYREEIKQPLRAEIKKERARVAQLETAIEPFKRWADRLDSSPNWVPDGCPINTDAGGISDFSVGQLRSLRAALSTPPSDWLAEHGYAVRNFTLETATQVVRGEVTVDCPNSKWPEFSVALDRKLAEARREGKMEALGNTDAAIAIRFDNLADLLEHINPVGWTSRRLKSKVLELRAKAEAARTLEEKNA